jgi:anti-sigma B factor antagonist
MPRPGAAGELAKVVIDDKDGITVAKITGEVDVSNASEISRQLGELPTHGLGLVIDLRDLSYLDSAGIAVLHDLTSYLRQRLQRLILVCRPDSPPRRVLELTALDVRAPILDELRPAIDALRLNLDSASS